MNTERIGRTPEDNDLWLCICGNHIWQSGFYPCAADGREVPGSEAKYYGCGDCGRVINPETLEVIARADQNLATP